MNATKSGPASVPCLSPLQLHETAREAHRIGNRGTLTLATVLHALMQSRGYYDLGYPSLHAYADTALRIGKSEAYDLARVGGCLQELPQLRNEFAAGKISYSMVKGLTRVAKADTEARWIGFSKEKPYRQVVADVMDAARTGRALPRKGRYGLPNLERKLELRFTAAEMEKVQGAFSSLAKEVANRLGKEAGDIAYRDVLLFMVERVLEGGLEKGGRAENFYSVLYQCCPDCSRSRMRTRDGFVEVEPGEVERVVGVARVEEIRPGENAGKGKGAVDRPTPARMRRQALMRDGGICANPCCDHEAEHGHHVVFLSRGGKTALRNLVGVCRTCHALVHAGLLRVSGLPGEDFRWEPKIAPVFPDRGMIQPDSGTAESGSQETKVTVA